MDDKMRILEFYVNNRTQGIDSLFWKDNLSSQIKSIDKKINEFLLNNTITDDKCSIDMVEFRSDILLSSQFAKDSINHVEGMLSERYNIDIKLELDSDFHKVTINIISNGRINKEYSGIKVLNYDYKEGIDSFIHDRMVDFTLRERYDKNFRFEIGILFPIDRNRSYYMDTLNDNIKFLKWHNIPIYEMTDPFYSRGRDFLKYDKVLEVEMRNTLQDIMTLYNNTILKEQKIHSVNMEKAYNKKYNIN